METKPTIIIDKSGLKMTPGGLNLLLNYITYFIRDNRARLDQYIFDTPHDVSQDPIAKEAQDVICQAVVVMRELETAKKHVVCMFQWHFEKEADVYRKTRIQLRLEKIEDDPSLYAVVLNVMEMLHRENQFFSREKFMSYINSEEVL